MPMIRVGSHNGGTEAGDAIRPIHKALNNVFFFNRKLGEYFSANVFFNIAFRVSGRTKDFGSEGPENLTKPRGKAYYSIDLVVPEKCWKDVEFEQFKEYILNNVEFCFEQLIAKVKGANELLDEKNLRFDFRKGIILILDAGPEDDLFHVSNGLKILEDMSASAAKKGEDIDKPELRKRMEQGIFI